MQELNRNFHETDGRPVASQRVTWHEGQMPRDNDEYDFDDDYRILEQQYMHEDPSYNEGVQMPR